MKRIISLILTFLLVLNVSNVVFATRDVVFATMQLGTCN